MTETRIFEEQAGKQAKADWSSMSILIFGAKSVAIGVYRAMKSLYPEKQILGFLVSSLENNPGELEGISVREISDVSAELSDAEKKNICVYVATPEIVHKQIEEVLKNYGFLNYKLVDSRTEADLMERYFEKSGRFPSLHRLAPGREKAGLSVYSAQFYKDKKLENPPRFPKYVHSMLLGCAGNSDKELEKNADFCDNTGDHISVKNPDYCEMTAFYWIWKNRIPKETDYVGVYHYRRMLDITEEDRKRLGENQVDVVLPFPMVHLPDIREHHSRYVNEAEWQAMRTALEELYPDYAKAFEDIFSQEYFYNYNILIAKKKIFADYCGWLFPLLFRTEELVLSGKAEKTGRYNAYMSESLLTLYFLYHKELNIFHTGRLVFT